MWTLQGYDAFDYSWYSLPGTWDTEAEAVAAARRRLQRLEQDQPSHESGGQTGIQDRVFVMRPDGTGYQVLPLCPEPWWRRLVTRRR